MRRPALLGALLATAFVAAGACAPLPEADPCPGALTCPNGVCCPVGTPYTCGGQCFSAASACANGYVYCSSGAGGGNSGSGGSGGQCGNGTYFDANTGACQLDPALALRNTNDHWSCKFGGGHDPCFAGFYQLELFDNGSGTSGNGKLVATGDPAGNEQFNWQIGSSVDSISVTQNTLFSLMTSIQPSAPTNATSFSAQITTTKGTCSTSCTLASGTF